MFQGAAPPRGVPLIWCLFGALLTAIPSEEGRETFSQVQTKTVRTTYDHQHRFCSTNS